MRTAIYFSLMSVVFLLGLLAEKSHAVPQLIGNQRHKMEMNDSIDDYMNRRYHADLSLDSPQVPGKGYGASVGVGYVHDLFGADLRLRTGSMQTGQFFSLPTQTEAATSQAASNPNSDINRSRSASASWSYFMIEPGVSVTGKLYPSLLKQWSQSARFGVAKSSFKESQSGLSYAGWIASAEALARYHFGYQSPYSVCLGLSLNWGWLTREGAREGFKNEETIPVRFARYIAGFSYSW